MKQKMITYALVMSMALLGGCYPQGAEYIDELDIVYSVYDEKYDFQTNSTYSMPDSIVLITGKEDEPPTYVKEKYATPIIQQIEKNMTNLGYSRVTKNQNPNIQLLPGAWNSTTIFVSGGYGGYYCWYYPYYCGGGWYYPYPIYTSYTTGTLVMNIIDPLKESADGNLQVVWTSAINGLLQGNFNKDRINKAIDQAFTQSSYLHLN